MEHVCFPLLVVTPSTLKHIIEKLLKNCPRCKCYFHKYFLTSDISFSILFNVMFLDNDIVLEALLST